MIAEFEARILALIDDMVEHASDDELFAGGYLRGHLTPAVAEAEEQGEHTFAEALKARVEESPHKAIAAGELAAGSDLGARHVENLYQAATPAA
ncbi:YfcL family protein [Serratia marcescens]|uniref:YfcL family protein n=1 Tax=Serratia marcescens TaxID=615 RepID=A0A939NMF6_SERMA|nr:YfcL family protein [Serratia marcescens]